MKRNILTYAKAGERRMPPAYELTISEMQQFYNIYRESPRGDELWDVVCIAYYTGFEAGARATSKAKARKGATV